MSKELIKRLAVAAGFDVAPDAHVLDGMHDGPPVLRGRTDSTSVIGLDAYRHGLKNGAAAIRAKFG